MWGFGWVKHIFPMYIDALLTQPHAYKRQSGGMNKGRKRERMRERMRERL